MKKAILMGLGLALVAMVAAPNARADEWNKKTILTFSQPVEIPGHVLPAGTYTFKLADSMSDRHVVQVFNADGSEIIATIIAIPDYRLKVTGETVIKFTEVPAGQPEAVRAWFYPGNSVGQEFVYPKRRAIELAQMTKAVVPALATDTDDAEALKTAPIVAVTPEEKEVPVAAAIQTTPENTLNDDVLHVRDENDRPFGSPRGQGAAENGQHPAARPAVRLRIHRCRVRPDGLRQALDDPHRVTTWLCAAGSDVPRREKVRRDCTALHRTAAAPGRGLHRPHRARGASRHRDRRPRSPRRRIDAREFSRARGRTAPAHLGVPVRRRPDHARA